MELTKDTNINAIKFKTTLQSMRNKSNNLSSNSTNTKKLMKESQLTLC